jgi:phenylacetate-CoA ligase
MTEIGPVSFECPDRPGVLHIIEDSYHVEVIDPQSGRPSEPGVQGELALTNLGRTGSPLIRYRTGDLVRPSPHNDCVCGHSGLALEGGILSRLDDMLVIRGVNVYPSAIESIVRQFPEIVEYRVIAKTQREMRELTIHIETGPNPKGVPKRLQNALRAALNMRIPVYIVPPGSLPRFELKARRWQID